MNKIISVVFLLVASVCLAIPALCDDKVSSQAAWQLIDTGAQVIDVRTPEEFAAGHLPMARNIDYEDILSHLNELDSDKSKTIVVYCASGRRAGKAKKALESVGYTRVVNAGGYDELYEARPTHGH